MNNDVIDWRSGETHLLLNPRLPDAERTALEQLAAATPPLKGHIWIATSGTSGVLKLAALSKRAILASAESVNRHLEATEEDRWCCVLPAFHVGGLGIFARAFLTGASVFETRWAPEAFCREEQITLSSLVPAQVRDLVEDKREPPRSLRAIVVGGGSLDPELYRKGRSLGWPLLPSYGMTECCSQIATASLRSLTSAEFPRLELLPHLDARREADGRLAFSGTSLLTGYAWFDEQGRPQFRDPKVDGWFISGDVGGVEGRALTVEGRLGEFVKIGGESVDLGRLDRILDQVLQSMNYAIDAAVLATADERLGVVIHLAAAGEESRATLLAEEFNARVLPIERARAVHHVAAIPRSELGKVLRSRLLETIRTS